MNGDDAIGLVLAVICLVYLLVVLIDPEHLG